MINIQYPNIKSVLTEKDGLNTLSISPLLPGFGHTLGNSLRRIFLSSIPGFSIARVRINDITHEYQPVDGVTEDAMNIILNLKLLKARIISGQNKVTLILKKSKPGVVTAADFEANSEVEIVNKDLYICTANSTADLCIEVDLERGVGYKPVKSKELTSVTNPKDILVDRVFSPVENVAFGVEQVRVGDNTNFEKITISYTTDGTVSGMEAAEFALKLMVDLSQNIHSSLSSAEEKIGTSMEVTNESEEIDLPARLKKILENNGITKNSELKNRVSEVPEFPGVGDKAIDAINDYVKSL